MTPAIQNTPVKIRVALLTLLCLPLFLLQQNLTVVMSDSIDATILWKSQSTIRLWDYVNFQLEEKQLPQELQPYVQNGHLTVTKRVACVAGQRLITQGMDYFCDEYYLGRAKNQTLKGNVLIPFHYTGVIPQGQVFLLGEHKDSFDSRYWGLVNQAALTRVVRIL